MVDSNKKLSTELVTTVRSAGVADLAKEYAEIGLDAVLSDGLLKDIPIVGTIIAIGKAGVSINDRVFAKKLVQFIVSLSTVSESDRNTMIDRLNEEEDFRNKVGERLIEILDRVDSHKKPEMIARVFQAYALKKIDVDTLNRLNFAIERLPHYEVKNLRKFHTDPLEERIGTAENLTLGALFNAGLATATSGYDAVVYKPTKVCDIFIELNLDK
jgi:hypothetical protein